MSRHKDGPFAGAPPVPYERDGRAGAGEEFGGAAHVRAAPPQTSGPGPEARAPAAQTRYPAIRLKYGAAGHQFACLLACLLVEGLVEG